ncbi:MAG: hypothetical protein Q9159_005937 [Coniocarpon cinnabarinum]
MGEAAEIHIYGSVISAGADGTKYELDCSPGSTIASSTWNCPISGASLSSNLSSYLFTLSNPAVTDSSNIPIITGAFCGVDDSHTPGGRALETAPAMSTLPSPLFTFANLTVTAGLEKLAPSTPAPQATATSSAMSTSTGLAHSGAVPAKPRTMTPMGIEIILPAVATVFAVAALFL